MVVRFWIIIVPLQSRQEKDLFQWTQRQIKRFPLLRCRNVEILKSQTAVEVNIRIMRAFVSMRRFIATNAQLFQRLETIEYHQLEMKQHQNVQIGFKTTR